MENIQRKPKLSVMNLGVWFRTPKKNKLKTKNTLRTTHQLNLSFLFVLFFCYLTIFLLQRKNDEEISRLGSADTALLAQCARHTQVRQGVMVR